LITDTKIYSSEIGSSVENWAYNWLCSMSNVVRDTTLNNVLQACKLAFKRDIKTLIFCLPYIVCKLEHRYVYLNNNYFNIHMYMLLLFISIHNRK